MISTLSAMRFGLAALFFVLFGSAAWGQSRVDAEHRLDAIRAQIRSVEREVQQTRGEEASGIRALEELDREILLRERLLLQYQTEVDSTRSETTVLRGTIDRLESEIESARASYRVRARHAYMHGRRNALALILASTSINQMIVRARYLQQFAQRRRRQLERIAQKTGEMRLREQSVRERMEATQRMVMQSQQERSSLGERRDERVLLVENVKSKRGRLERDLQQRRSDARQMEGMVQQLVAQERRRAEEERQRAAEAARQAEARAEAARVAEAERRAQIQREAVAAARRAQEREVRSRPTPRSEAQPSEVPPEVATTRPTPRATPPTSRTTPAPRAETRRPSAPPPPATDRTESLTGSFRTNRGRLPWPVDGTVTGSFGTRTDPVYGTTINSIGIDISTVAAAPARAVFEGTVERVGSMATYGTFVMVSHGDFTTIYGNLSQVSVSRGQTVRAGEVIGRAGTSENRRGSQLFFALFQGGSPSNPIGWLR